MISHCSGLGYRRCARAYLRCACVPQAHGCVPSSPSARQSTRIALRTIRAPSSRAPHQTPKTFFLVVVHLEPFANPLCLRNAEKNPLRGLYVTAERVREGWHQWYVPCPQAVQHPSMLVPCVLIPPTLMPPPVVHALRCVCMCVCVCARARMNLLSPGGLQQACERVYVRVRDTVHFACLEQDRWPAAPIPVQNPRHSDRSQRALAVPSLLQ